MVKGLPIKKGGRKLEDSVESTDLNSVPPKAEKYLSGSAVERPIEGARAGKNHGDHEAMGLLEGMSLESIVELKIARFLDQIGDYYPENLHALMMRKVERPLLAQILQRTGGNQVQAAKILGINRNTLRKKMKIYGLYP